jgi:hypothetical protein
MKMPGADTVAIVAITGILCILKNFGNVDEASCHLH